MPLQPDILLRQRGDGLARGCQFLAVALNFGVSPEGGVDGFLQILSAPRLDEEAQDFCAIDGVNHRAEIQDRSDEDSAGVRLNIADLREELEPGQLWHLMVGKHHGIRLLPKSIQAFGNGQRGFDVVAHLPERIAEGDKDDLFIVDDKNLRRCFRAGAARWGAHNELRRSKVAASLSSR